MNLLEFQNLLEQTLMQYLADLKDQEQFENQKIEPTLLDFVAWLNIDKTDIMKVQYYHEER